MTLCLRWDEPIVYQPENRTVKAASRLWSGMFTPVRAFVIPNRAPSPVRNLLLLSVNLPRSLLQQTLLQFLLALDAVPRPRHRFQSLGVDLFAAVDAFAKAAFANAGQRPLDHLQQLPLVVALAEQKLFGVRTGGAVGNVLRRIFIGRAAVGLGARYRAAQV